jgi:catechol 2,3-dioxygenase-like lactoylglutathione lyase family enzyme
LSIGWIRVLTTGRLEVVAGERTHPILPCPDLKAAVEFYGALGFAQTYGQTRPNPYAVVALEDIIIHLAGIAGFDPATSVSSVIVVVPDAGALWDHFAGGLRRHYGRVPGAGVPRLLRPRRKRGTATGFSVVDTGGNWLRFYRAGEFEGEGESNEAGGLAGVVEVAARHGDARGDDVAALAVLDRGLRRHQAAPVLEQARTLLYRAEVLLRLGRHDEAVVAVHQATSWAESDDTGALADELAHAREIVGIPD